MLIDERDQVVVVSLAGDQCAGLWKLIEPRLERGKRDFVLEMSQSTFLNSLNIAAIIAARNKVHSAGGRLVLAGLADNIKAVFRILKLERLFVLDHSLESAIKQLQ
jgi:anti-anti-sigma factor